MIRPATRLNTTSANAPVIRLKPNCNKVLNNVFIIKCYSGIMDDITLFMNSLSGSEFKSKFPGSSQEIVVLNLTGLHSESIIINYFIILDMIKIVAKAF